MSFCNAQLLLGVFSFLPCFWDSIVNQRVNKFFTIFNLRLLNSKFYNQVKNGLSDRIRVDP